MQRQLILIQQHAPVSQQGWRYLETITTIDGPRTRVVDGLYATSDEALEALAKRLDLPEEK